MREGPKVAIKNLDLNFRIKLVLTVLDFYDKLQEKKVVANKFQESFEKDDIFDSTTKYFKSEISKYDKLGKKKPKPAKKGKSLDKQKALKSKKKSEVQENEQILNALEMIDDGQVEHATVDGDEAC